jgi:hypothetical protein
MLFPIVLKAAGTLDALHGHYESKYGAKAGRTRLAPAMAKKRAIAAVECVDRPSCAWRDEILGGQ